MAVINFIFVYFCSGLVLALVFRGIFKDKINSAILTVLGFGIAPLLLSLIQFYLYWFFPHQAWFFYVIIIYSIWVSLLFVILYFEHTRRLTLAIPQYQSILKGFKKLTIVAKLLCVFLLFIIIFVFVRGQLYPTIWDDAILYFQQAHVYSIDRSLDRLDTLIPFQDDGSGYVMNPVIRPAIPILYSFFYTGGERTIFIFSGSFLYFYYFILTIVLFALILIRLKFDVERTLIGLTLFLTCFYFINFLIYGFKEIILAFFLLFGLLACYETVGKTKTIQLNWTIILACILGFAITINYSGLIIAAITCVLYLVVLLAHRVKFISIIIYCCVLSSGILLISGVEINNDVGFIFGHPIFSHTTTQLSSSAVSELTVYKIAPSSNATSHVTATTNDDNLDPIHTTITPITTNFDTADQSIGIAENLLIKGKLQGLTQPQFYGFVMWLFIVVLTLQFLQRSKSILFEKIILSFAGLFFFIIMDPFFLNHHPQAYVLSISPKYTILLVPLVALYITTQYAVILKVFTKLNLKYLLLLSVFILLLVPQFRGEAVAVTIDIFQRVTPLYNSLEYYNAKFTELYSMLAIAAVLFSSISAYYILRGVDLRKKVLFLNSTFLIIGFIGPFLFLLNNNYPLVNTFKYLAIPSEQRIIHNAVSDPNTVSMLEAINYLNNNTNPSAKVLFLYYRNYVYYMNNYHRFLFDQTDKSVDQTLKHSVDVQSAEYILVRKADLEVDEFTQPTSVVQEFGELVLLRVQQ